MGIAYCWVPDRHLAEDAAQEAFVIACRDLGRLKACREVRRLAQGDLPKGGPSAGQIELRCGLPAEMPATATANPGDDRASEVRQSVQRLPERAREVILLHYFSGLSYDEIADTLKTSPQAVHGRLIRARRKMADDLRRNGLGRRES